MMTLPRSVMWLVFRDGAEGDDESPVAFVGIFSTEERALAACTDESCWVGPAVLDEFDPNETDSFVDWAGAYCPEFVWVITVETLDPKGRAELLEVFERYDLALHWLKGAEEDLCRWRHAREIRLEASESGVTQLVTEQTRWVVTRRLKRTVPRFR